MRRTITIYSADIESWKPIIERELNGAGGRISPATLERAKRFLRAEDAHRCIGAELLRDHALRSASGVDAAQARVLRDEHGKPFLPDVPDVHFNVSHSGKMVLCAVDRYPVGVDVEKIRTIDLDVADSCFTPRERERLAAGNPDEVLNGFYRLWTLKESYLKALGTGLSRDPLSVEIAPPDADEHFWRTEDEHTMQVLAVPEGYAGAVCGRGEYRVKLDGLVVE